MGECCSEMCCGSVVWKYFRCWNRTKTFIASNNVSNFQDVHVFLSSVEKKLRFLMKTFQDFSPYNGLQWGRSFKKYISFISSNGHLALFCVQTRSSKWTNLFSSHERIDNKEYFKAVVLNSSPRDTLLFTICMSLLSDTLSSVQVYNELRIWIRCVK